MGDCHQVSSHGWREGGAWYGRAAPRGRSAGGRLPCTVAAPVSRRAGVHLFPVAANAVWAAGTGHGLLQGAGNPRGGEGAEALGRAEPPAWIPGPGCAARARPAPQHCIGLGAPPHGSGRPGAQQTCGMMSTARGSCRSRDRLSLHSLRPPKALRASHCYSSLHAASRQAEGRRRTSCAQTAAMRALASTSAPCEWVQGRLAPPEAPPEVGAGR